LTPKRTFTHVPAKTALALTGSAIALAGYMGASSNSTGHDGHGARQAGTTAGLTASHRVQASGTGDAGTSGLSTGPTSGLSTGLSTGLGTGSTGDPGTIDLAAYGTAQKDPRPWRHDPRYHPNHHERHHRVRHHHGQGHRGRRHWVRLQGSPWQIAGALMPAYHWTSWQFRYLNLLWMRESGWNRFAYNHSSGAYGIPQAVPGDKMAAAGPDWRTSARTQIIWGMGYIQSRYGNPWNAWQHELRYGWY
jgi:hypothetical protein